MRYGRRSRSFSARRSDASSCLRASLAQSAIRFTISERRSLRITSASSSSVTAMGVPQRPWLVFTLVIIISIRFFLLQFGCKGSEYIRNTQGNGMLWWNPNVVSCWGSSSFGGVFLRGLFRRCGDADPDGAEVRGYIKPKNSPHVAHLTEN